MPSLTRLLARLFNLSPRHAPAAPACDHRYTVVIGIREADGYMKRWRSCTTCRKQFDEV